MFKVCVVEDEIILRKGLIKAIDWEQLGCEVVGEASNGKDGIALIEKTKPDIIILDVNMPIMDGLEMIDQLPRHTYSFIIVSGHSEFDYAKRAIAYNVTEYLLKPLDHDLLNQAILRAIDDLKINRQHLSKQTSTLNDQYHFFNLNQVVDSITMTLILDYIRANYAEKITMEDLSVITQKSSSSISNRFQQYLKMSFNDYLTQYRIQTAVDFIETLDYHLYQIAEMVGFSDYKYFNRVFKKTMGVSPKIVETYYLRKNK